MQYGKSKKRKLLVKNRNVLITNLGVFIISICCLVIMIMMGPTQDTGDDALLAWQLSRGVGSLGSFISPFLSLIENILYALFPQIPWWSVHHVFSAWVLLFITFLYIQHNCQGVTKIFWYLISFLGVWIAILEKVNFTRTASAYAAAGAMLLFYGYQTLEKDFLKSKVMNALGTGLLVLGAMTRFQPALLVFPFLGICVIVSEFEAVKYKWKKILKCITIKKLIYCVTPLLGLILLVLFNNLFWTLNPEWKEYNEYNEARSEIADYVEFYPTWEEAEEEYRALGLKDKNDLQLLFSIVFLGDTEIYDLETLQGIGELRDDETSFKDKLHGMMERVGSMVLEGRMQYLLILVLMVLIFFYKPNTLIGFTLNYFYISIFLAFFSFLGRMMLRVWEPVLLTMIILLMQLCSSHEYHNKVYIKKNKMKKSSYVYKFVGRVILTSIICIITVANCEVIETMRNLQFPDETVDRHDVTRNRGDYINSERDKIYLLSMPLIHHPPYPGVFGLWEGIPKDYCPNLFALSNWEAMTPENLNNLNKIGIENPVKALVERDDTYADYYYPVWKLLTTHYGANITCSKVDEFVDTGSIVQYTAPILRDRMNQVSANISFDEFMYSVVNSTDAWIMQGQISNTENVEIECLYFNIEVDGETYSYRLAYEENKFYGALYGLDKEFSLKENTCYFVGKSYTGKYYMLGNIIE